MGKVEQRPTFIEDLYERKLNASDDCIEKIKKIVREMTILEIENKKDSKEYKKLESLLEEAEERISEIWF